MNCILRQLYIDSYTRAIIKVTSAWLIYTNQLSQEHGTCSVVTSILYILKSKSTIRFVYFCLSSNQWHMGTVINHSASCNMHSGICWNIPLSARYIWDYALNYWTASNDDAYSQFKGRNETAPHCWDFIPIDLVSERL